MLFSDMSQEFGPGEEVPTGFCKNCAHPLGVHDLPGEACDYCTCKHAVVEVRTVF